MATILAMPLFSILAACDAGKVEPTRDQEPTAVWRPNFEITEQTRYDKIRPVTPKGEAVGYWPCWRGPTMQNWAAGDHYPEQWSLKDRDNVLWDAKISGHGASSPIVWNDRVFITASSVEGKFNSVFCFDRVKGTDIWRADSPTPSAKYGKLLGNSAFATPSTDGERVFAYFGDNLLTVDFDGRQVWHRKFEDLKWEYHLGASPLLFQDRLVVVIDHEGSSGSFIAAYDNETGDELGRTVRSSHVGWSSPIAIQVNGVAQIVVVGSNGVSGYDPSDGAEQWFIRKNMGQVMSTPVVGHDLLFFSGFASETGIFAVRLAQVKNGLEPQVVWERSHGAPKISSMVLVKDTLLALNDTLGIVTCLDARTGKRCWQIRLKQPSNSTAYRGYNFFFVTGPLGRTLIRNFQKRRYVCGRYQFGG